MEQINTTIPIAHSWIASKKPKTVICTWCLTLPLCLTVIRAGAGHHDCEVHWDGKSRPWCLLQIEKGIRSIKPLRPLSCFLRSLLNRQYNQYSCWYLLAEHYSQDKCGQDLGGDACAFHAFQKIGMIELWYINSYGSENVMKTECIMLLALAINCTFIRVFNIAFNEWSDAIHFLQSTFWEHL